MKLVTNRKNRTFAIPAAAEATPANPTTPAITATARKTSAMVNTVRTAPPDRKPGPFVVSRSGLTRTDRRALFEQWRKRATAPTGP